MGLTDQDLDSKSDPSQTDGFPEPNRLIESPNLEPTSQYDELKFKTPTVKDRWDRYTKRSIINWETTETNEQRFRLYHYYEWIIATEFHCY